MKIGIYLDNYESPMEEITDSINVYGMDTELGYLKLSPMRLPAIISEKRALEQIERFGKHEIRFPINGLYELIGDDRTLIAEDGDLCLCGDTYVAKIQGKKCTGLSYREILKCLNYAYDGDRWISPEKPILTTLISCYELDAERGCWV